MQGHSLRWRIASFVVSSFFSHHLSKGITICICRRGEICINKKYRGIFICLLTQEFSHKVRISFDSILNELSCRAVVGLSTFWFFKMKMVINAMLQTLMNAQNTMRSIWIFFIQHFHKNSHTCVDGGTTIITCCRNNTMHALSKNSVSYRSGTSAERDWNLAESFCLAITCNSHIAFKNIPRLNLIHGFLRSRYELLSFYRSDSLFRNAGLFK